MAALSMESLPLGFRFRPTDEELINYYLKLKVNGRDSEVQVIPEVDVCKWEPWDLPGLSVIKTADPEWFFFCPRDRKYPNGHRSNRATDSGYWKATGKDRTIKSKKTLIGMKKTLVFYRGRAPKGERTNWIMHEYRPTQKELDGTGPGQNPFVLFRLFHKPDDKINGVKPDEAEPTGSSPTTSKSSPDDASSDVVQETATSDSGMQVEKQSDDAKRWLADKSDGANPNSVLTNGSHGNGFMASDMEDLTGRGTSIEAFPLHGENSTLSWPTLDPLDYRLFSQVQSNIDAARYMDSCYASDFGNDNNGFDFQDGTSEQDVLLTDLLDEVLNNHDKSSCEESTSLKNSVLPSGNSSSENPFLLNSVPQENFLLNENSNYGDTGTDMAQLQYVSDLEASKWFNGQTDSKESLQLQNSFGSWDTQASLYGQLGQDGLYAYPTAHSFSNKINSLEQPTIPNYHMNVDGNVTGGTGIKIRVRQPQRWPNPGFVDQGTAHRRIHLQMKTERNQSGRKYELQSGTVETTEAADTVPHGRARIKIRTRNTRHQVKPDNTAKQDDQGEGEKRTVNEVSEKFWGQTLSKEPSRNLRLRQKQGEPGSPQEMPSMSKLHRRSSPSLRYIVAIFLLVMMFVGLIGIWSSLRS